MKETAMTSPWNNIGRKTLIPAARGVVPADILFTNADIFNPFTGTWEDTSFAVSDGIVIGIGSYRAKKEVNLNKRRVIPGLIDAHVHIESSLLAPPEFARLVASHGTTTIIADPHEIANVCGADGIRFMLSFRGSLPLDLFIMLPSCVPATPRDAGGAILSAGDLGLFAGQDGVLGLGEIMNVSGVLNAEPDILLKLDLFPLIDGHAPLLTGKDLNAYIIAGIQSDHESTGAMEAREKLERGMYLFVREGSAERNIRQISPIIAGGTVRDVPLLPMTAMWTCWSMKAISMIASGRRLPAGSKRRLLSGWQLSLRQKGFGSMIVVRSRREGLLISAYFIKEEHSLLRRRSVGVNFLNWPVRENAPQYQEDSDAEHPSRTISHFTAQVLR